jgi:hypothetical protein
VPVRVLTEQDFIGSFKTIQEVNDDSVPSSTEKNIELGLKSV